MHYHNFLFQAAKEAKKSDCKFQLGCLALKNNKIVSKGFNRYSKSNSWTKRKGECSIHAEQICLNRTGNHYIDTLFIVRLGANGFNMALPCKRCMAHIKRRGIKTIYFTDWQGIVQKLSL